MNVIQAKHLYGISDKRYTYRLPDGVIVTADMLLLVENQKNGQAGYSAGGHQFRRREPKYSEYDNAGTEDKIKGYRNIFHDTNIR